MAQKKSKSGISRLLQFAESKKYLVSVSCVLSAVGTVLSLCPFICLWYVAKEIFAVLPNLGEVSLSSLMTYAWAAVAFAVGGFLAYYIALLCSHLAAFSIAKNIKVAVLKHLTTLPLGYFSRHGSYKCYY